MAADVGQAFCGWAPELAEQQEAQELSVSDDGFSSFGSFKFDSLDWEKRSVFTRNRCQEELEKFKNPGLVARKKAFFEERYKKIRAQKAMEENQQLILDDGSSRSISNRIQDETSVHIEIRVQKAMEESQQLILDDGSSRTISNRVTDEISMHNEIIGDGASNVDVHLEETSFQVTLHKKQSCEDMQIQNTSSTLHSSTGGCLDVNKETTDDCSLHLQDLDSDLSMLGSDCSIHLQDLDSDFSMLEPLKRTEEIEPHFHLNIDDKDSLRRPGNSELTAQLEKDSSGTEVQTHHRDTQVTCRPSLVQAELVEESQFSGHDDKDTSMKSHVLESNDDLATAGTVIHLANSDAVKDSSCSEVQSHPRDTQVTGRSSLAQAELVVESQFSGHDDKDTSMKNCVLESNDDLAAARTLIHRANSDAVKLDNKDISLMNCILESNVDLATAMPVIHHADSDGVKSYSSIAQEKAKPHVRNQKGNAAVTKLMKGSDSSARYLLKVDFKSQTTTTQSPKHHSQQLVGKAKITLGPCKATLDKVSTNIRSSTVASHKPLTGACSKSTIPVPVSIGMERRTRDNALKLQDPAMKAARTCSVNNGESEDKRGSEQIPEKKRPTSRRGRVPNLPEPLKDQKSNELENKRGSGQVKERRPTSRRGRVTNSSEPPNQKSKGLENKGGSDEVRERRPMSCSGRPVNLKDKQSEGTVNQRGSEQVRGKTVSTALTVRAVCIREPLKDQKSRTSENKRGSEQVRERILPGGPVLRAVNVSEPPKEKRIKGSESLRGSVQVRVRALPNVVNVSDSPNAKISRSVNLPAQNQSNPHGGGVYRSTVAVRKNEPNEVASSRADPFSHKGKRPLSSSRSQNGTLARPLSSSRSQNGTLARQEMRPWR